VRPTHTSIRPKPSAPAGRGGFRRRPRGGERPGPFGVGRPRGIGERARPVHPNPAADTSGRPRVRDDLGFSFRVGPGRGRRGRPGHPHAASPHPVAADILGDLDRIRPVIVTVTSELKCVKHGTNGHPPGDAGRATVPACPWGGDLLGCEGRDRIWKRHSRGNGYVWGVIQAERGATVTIGERRFSCRRVARRPCRMPRRHLVPASPAALILRRQDGSIIQDVLRPGGTATRPQDRWHFAERCFRRHEDVGPRKAQWRKSVVGSCSSSSVIPSSEIHRAAETFAVESRVIEPTVSFVIAAATSCQPRGDDGKNLMASDFVFGEGWEPSGSPHLSP